MDARKNLVTIVMLLVLFVLFGMIIYLHGELTLFKANYYAELAKECPVCPVAEAPAVVAQPPEEPVATPVEEAPSEPVVYVPPAINPIMTNEKYSHVVAVNVTPACISGYPGGTIFYKTGLKPKNMTIQVKTQDSYYEPVFSPGTAIDEGYLYFTICGKGEISCAHKGSFALEQDLVYVLRIAFEQNVIEYSNEHVVDTSVLSPFRDQKCRG